MKSVIVPVNGSECALRAVHYLIGAHAEGLRPLIHLVNVQIEVTGDVRQFVASEDVRGYQREHSDEALRGARSLLDAASIPCQVHEAAGSVPEQIVRLAESLRCDHLVMGTHGRLALADLLLSSTTLRVLHQTGLPVVLIK